MILSETISPTAAPSLSSSAFSFGLSLSEQHAKRKAATDLPRAPGCCGPEPETRTTVVTPKTSLPSSSSSSSSSSASCSFERISYYLLNDYCR